MVETGFSSLDTMVDKANRLLKDVEEAFEWPKERRKQSYAALRAVLHPLRDRLPVETAVHSAPNCRPSSEASTTTAGNRLKPP
ncbi:DUF2267 domain-containing protein [Streptomyces prasinus]|uniref:DUF2267 domain-containing protein n=1 Tax=Streptomyces prasinus TaxID=67345 RepID=UPI0033AC4058